MRVLIVKLSSLGDVVHAMPAVQDMRRAFSNTAPGIHIDWVVEPGFAALVQRCEGLGRVIPCAIRRWRKAPFSKATRTEWAAFKQQLQAERYDAVIDLQGLSKSALVAWLARTTPNGKRYAMANRTDGSGYEAPTRWVADVAMALEPHVHAVQRSRLLCAAALGYAVQGADCYRLASNIVAASTRPQSARPLIAFVHGTSRADKEWPLEHWVELGKRLNDSGFSIVLAHGNATERARSEAIAAKLPDAQVWPSMGLDALMDAMSQCAGVIGVDSGLSHIAVALNLPHVQIYNFDTAWRTGPKSSSQVSVYAQACPKVDAVWQAWQGVRT